MIQGDKLVPTVDFLFQAAFAGTAATIAVSYTHLRAHETKANLVCRLLLEKKKRTKRKKSKHKHANNFNAPLLYFFFNDTATTEIYT